MDGVLLNQELVFRVIDLTGVFCGGCLGGTVARRHKFDFVGFLILGISTALGGGVLRDIMLNLTPIALTNGSYLIAAVCGVFISMVLRIDDRKFWINLFSVIDALTVGSWAATGASKTLAAGLGVGPALLLGVVTAIGGGIIRDVLVGRTPEVFGGNTLYATPALAGAAGHHGAWHWLSWRRYDCGHYHRGCSLPTCPAFRMVPSGFTRLEY